MRQHKLALCKEHYLEWVPAQVERTILRYRLFTHEDKLIVAVSGGKDSLSLWDILWRLGYQAEGLYIGLGIHGETGYSETSRKLAEQFAIQRSLNLRIVDVLEEYGSTIPDIAAKSNRGRNKPCAACGLAKRHIMNQAARIGNFTVLATGHNLDDEAAILFGNTLHWASSYLIRQAPLLEADAEGLIRKVKPLCRMYEREMAAYALLRGIDYVYEECPFATGSTTIYYKELLNKLEAEQPGAKLNFYLTFLQAKEGGLFNEKVDSARELLHNCPQCGEPTTAPTLCAFCNMIGKTSA